MSKVPIVIAAVLGCGGLTAVFFGGLPALSAGLLCSGSALSLSASISAKLRYRLGLTAGIRLGRALERQEAERKIA